MNNVAVYLISDGMGGAEQVVWQTINGLQKNDSIFLIVNNEIASFYSGILPEIRFLNIGDIFLHSKRKFKLVRFLLHNRYFSFIPWIIRSRSKIIAEFIDRNNITIIHSHLDYTLYSSLCIKKIIKNIELIHTVHSAFGLIENKYFKPSVSLSRINFKLVSKLVFVSNYIHNLYLAKNIPINKFKVIYNGIDQSVCDSFKRKQKANKEFEILYVGGSKYVKGFDILVETVELISKLEIQDCFHVNFLGNISESSNLFQNVRQRGIEKYFRFEGFITPPHHLEFFKTADILFMPSRSEALPIAAIEAVLFDLPVISSSVGGLPEIIEHNKNGLIGSNNPLEYSEFILRMATDYNTFLNRTIEYNGQKKSQFDAKSMCQNLIDLY